MKLPLLILAAASIIFLLGRPTPAHAGAETKPLPPEIHVYDTGEVDSPPKPTRRVMPESAAVERTGKTATCVLIFVVTPKGRTAHIVAAETNNPAWATACIEALSSWRFTPAKRKGEPVHCRLQIPMDYQPTE